MREQPQFCQPGRFFPRGVVRPRRCLLPMWRRTPVAQSLPTRRRTPIARVPSEASERPWDSMGLVGLVLCIPQRVAGLRCVWFSFPMRREPQDSAECFSFAVRCLFPAVFSGRGARAAVRYRGQVSQFAALLSSLLPSAVSPAFALVWPLVGLAGLAHGPRRGRTTRAGLSALAVALGLFSRVGLLGRSSTLRAVSRTRAGFRFSAQRHAGREFTGGTTAVRASQRLAEIWALARK